jgi:valyl-tRNA synthetase
MRNFCNKIWNAVRYVLMNLDVSDPSLLEGGLPGALAAEDKWVLSRYNRLVSDVTGNLEKYELGIAAGKLYDFFWDILCDWYIELSKSRMQEGGEAAARAGRVLLYVLDGALRLLHPFMPFITEEVWQALPFEGETLMLKSWPVYREDLAFAKEEESFSMIVEAIGAIRARRAELNVPPTKKARVQIETAHAAVFAEGATFIGRLASASSVEIGNSFSAEGAVQAVISGARILLPLSELIDAEKERERLTKEKSAILKDISQLKGKLSNESFVTKAPPAVVEGEREKLVKAEALLAKIEESLRVI